MIIIFEIIEINKVKIMIYAFLVIDSTASPDFSKYSVIHPKIFHGREKRQISTTSEKVSNPFQFALKFS